MAMEELRYPKVEKNLKSYLVVVQYCQKVSKISVPKQTFGDSYWKIQRKAVVRRTHEGIQKPKTKGHRNPCFDHPNSIFQNGFTTDASKQKRIRRHFIGRNNQPVFWNQSDSSAASFLIQTKNLQKK